MAEFGLRHVNPRISIVGYATNLPVQFMTGFLVRGHNFRFSAKHKGLHPIICKEH